LKISFNLKNGRVKASSEACLDLKYYLHTSGEEIPVAVESEE